MTQIQKFRSPSSIIFKVESNDEPRPMLFDTKRGQTFLLDGKVCMRGDVSAYQVIKDLEPHIYNRVKEDLICAVWVTNLQTGRTYTAINQEIEFIKVTMSIEGV